MGVTLGTFCHIVIDNGNDARLAECPKSVVNVSMSVTPMEQGDWWYLEVLEFTVVHQLILLRSSFTVTHNIALIWVYTLYYIWEINRLCDEFLAKLR